MFGFGCYIGPLELPIIGFKKLVMFPFIPRTQVEEKNGETVVYFEIPGVKKEDIGLYVSEKALRLKAKVSEEARKFPWTPEEYRKSIYLPTPIDVERVKSKYENGILTVTLPKKVSGKRITIE